jgi:hypothetical protein
MLTTHYVGLDIHNKTISFCVRQADGTIVKQGALAANCQALDDWLSQVPQPWIARMEATMFKSRVYDHLMKPSPHVKAVWLYFRTGRLHLLEPTKELSPHVAFPRRQ